MKFFRFGKSQKQQFASFAVNACKSQQTITVNFKDVYQLVLEIEKSFVKLMGYDPHEALQKAIENLELACPKCGALNDQAKDLVLIELQEESVKEMKEILFGSLIGTLDKGKCPSCMGTKVNVAFTPLIQEDNV